MFMDRDNYKDLRVRDYTELVVPELRDKIYSLPVLILIFHESPRDRIKCTLERARTVTPITLDLEKQSSHVLHVSEHVTRLMFKVEATSEKSGMYRVSCKGHYYYPFDDNWFPVEVEKSIMLRFEQCKRHSMHESEGVNTNKCISTTPRITVACDSDILEGFKELAFLQSFVENACVLGKIFLSACDFLLPQCQRLS